VTLSNLLVTSAAKLPGYGAPGDYGQSGAPGNVGKFNSPKQLEQKQIHKAKPY
jgi:hypothetical protein